MANFLAGFPGRFWNSLLYIFFEMSPYVILGLLAAGILKVFIPERWILKTAGSRGFGVPPLMSLIGVPLPLCSCSVLPFAAGLRKEGASKGAVVSFLTSTPQTGVDSILVAYSFFGLPFAMFKTAVSFVSGSIAGWFSNWFGRGRKAGLTAGTEGLETADGQDEPCRIPAEEGVSCAGGECCAEGASEPAVAEKRARRRSRITEVMTYAYDELLGDFALVFLIGIIGSAVVSTIVPPDFFAGFAHRWVYYPAILALSLPLYVCATASVPIAFALMQAGIPPGAAMVLLVAGPATNIATLGVVGKLLGRKSTVIYVLTIIATAVLAGVLFDRFFTLDFAILGGNGADRRGVPAGVFEFPMPVQVGSSILLAGLLVFHILRRGVGKLKSS